MTSLIPPLATFSGVNFDKFFKCLPNITAEDPRISWDAKGLLWYMCSRSDDFKVHTWHLSKIYKGKKKGNGKDSISRMINELKNLVTLPIENSKMN